MWKAYDKHLIISSAVFVLPQPFNHRLWLYIQLSNMLQLNRYIDRLDLKIVDFNFAKSEEFSLTWSWESRQRDTTSSK